MTNKQWFQRTFSVLHASESSLVEIMTAKCTRRLRVSRLAVICAAVLLLIGLASIACATGLGVIHHTIKGVSVFNGSENGYETDMALEIREDICTMTYRDQDGMLHEIEGVAKVAVDADGSMRLLTDPRTLSPPGSPTVQYRDDGSVWVYYQMPYSHGIAIDNDDNDASIYYASDCEAIEITDRFNADGVCYIQLETKNGTRYLTIKYQGDFVSSRDGYVPPASVGAEE